MTQRTSDIIDVGIRIAREFGFPILMLVWFTFLVSQAAATLHHTVLIPVVESHTTFLESTTETLKTLGRTQERQAETLQEIAEGQHQIKQVLSRTANGGG